MRSTLPSAPAPGGTDEHGATAPADQTLRARIRDSAIALFGQGGFDKVTVRQIAQRAEVSPGLVIHHFTSKAGLRHACDEHVVATVLHPKAEVVGHSLTAGLRDLFNSFDAHAPLLTYLTRMVSDGSDGGNDLFDRLVAESRVIYTAGVDAGTIHDSTDSEATAVLLTLYGLAPLLLSSQLARIFERETVGVDLFRRLLVPQTEIFSRGLYADRSIRDATAELVTSPAPRADEETPDV